MPHEQAVLIIAAGLNNQGIDNRLKSEIYKLLTQYFVGVISDFEKKGRVYATGNYIT